MAGSQSAPGPACTDCSGARSHGTVKMNPWTRLRRSTIEKQIVRLRYRMSASPLSIGQSADWQRDVVPPRLPVGRGLGATFAGGGKWLGAPWCHRPLVAPEGTIHRAEGAEPRASEALEAGCCRSAQQQWRRKRFRDGGFSQPGSKVEAGKWWQRRSGNVSGRRGQARLGGAVAVAESVMEMDLAAGSRGPVREQEKKRRPGSDPTREAESRPIQFGRSRTGTSALPPCREVSVKRKQQHLTLPSLRTGRGRPLGRALTDRSHNKGPDITVVATSRSGGAFDFYGRLG